MPTITVETFIAYGENSRSDLRVRPIAGQIYPQSMRVECPKLIRDMYPIGTKFTIYVEEKRKEGGELFLYCYRTWRFEPLKES